MTSRDFCYWLQGYFELSKSPEGLSCAQAECIKRHLAMVFVHEIDPSMGGHDVQAALNKIHYQGPQPGPDSTGVAPTGLGPVYRC